MLERSVWKGTEGSLQPTASKEPRPPVQQPLNNWILPTTWVSLEVDPFPVKLSDEAPSPAGESTAALGDPEVVEPAKACLDF